MNKIGGCHSRPLAASAFGTTTIERRTYREHHCTLHPLPGEPPKQMVQQLARFLREKGAIIVRHEIFGSIALQPEIISALRLEFGSLDWPIMWVEGPAYAARGIAGMNIFAVAGTRVDTVCLGDRPVGRVFSDDYSRHCLIGDVIPVNLALSRIEQCRQAFELLDQALGSAGMSMADVVRTWFYLDEILSWYDEFNLVRNEFFRKHGVFKGLMPASTGIGGKNPSGSALIVGAWAIQRLSSDLTIGEAPSPLQRPSTEYGSAFSRAVTIKTPDAERLLISGTACIDPNGLSMYPGDVGEQIALTMEVVRQILCASSFSFSDITRATAYFKNLDDATAFEVWRRKHGASALPIVVTQADICREELLFEIELDAFAHVRRR